jgi:hypothetical protein
VREEEEEKKRREGRVDGGNGEEGKGKREEGRGKREEGRGRGRRKREGKRERASVLHNSKKAPSATNTGRKAGHPVITKEMVISPQKAQQIINILREKENVGPA